MDRFQAAHILTDGEVVEENKLHERIWPNTIDGRWLQPGEMVIKHAGQFFVVKLPFEEVTPKT